MTSSKDPRLQRIVDEHRAGFQKLLLEGLGKGIDSESPRSLLSMASMLLDIVSGASDRAATASLIRLLLELDRPEASAGALAMAAVAGDDGLRRQLRREIADRGHHLPSWLVHLHRAKPVDRAVEVSDPFRVEDQLLVGVVVPSGHPLTAVVRVNNELGCCAVVVTVLVEPLDTVTQRIGGDDSPDVTLREISTADARARITAAVRRSESSTLFGDDLPWRSERPLLTWLLTLLPDGGDAAVPGRWDDDVDLDDVLADFLASPWGRPWARGSLPLVAEELLYDGLGNGLGDPLLWAPHHVARVLDPKLPGLHPDELDVVRTPELLRDLIRYGHSKRGLRLDLTDRSLAAVDRHAGAFTAAVLDSERWVS